MTKFFFRLFLLLQVAVSLTLSGVATVRAEPSLCQRLEREKGLDEVLVKRYCLVAGKLRVDTKIIGKNLKQVEYKATYDRFLKPASVQRARDFLQDNHEWLRDVEKRYKVAADIITAIFLVESDLGRYPGRYHLIEVFSSLASCVQERYLRQVYRELKPKFPDLDYAWLKRRARKKSAWGYTQLVALLQLSDRLDVDLVKGSWAGAFGICQFIPSSCLSYAVDGSGDGRIDLYDFEDAAASVANYLKAHGWRPGLNVKQQEKVVLTYNHSRLYCETIVALAGKLR